MEDAHVARRRFLGTLAAAASLPLFGRAARGTAVAVPATPSATEGPFYPTPDLRPADTGNDLTAVAGIDGRAEGEVLDLAGTLRDSASGRPLADATVEIWQCDSAGRYLHQRQSNLFGPGDTRFQGYGATQTDAEGRYAFRTILPVPYAGRTPHIHFKVSAPGGGRLTGQIYLAGHPMNARDFLFRRLSEAERAATSIDPAQRGDGTWEAAFRIALASG